MVAPKEAQIQSVVSFVEILIEQPMPAKGKIFLLSVFSDQLAYLLSSPLIQNSTLYYNMFTADSSFSFKDFKMQLISVEALSHNLLTFL